MWTHALLEVYCLDSDDWPEGTPADWIERREVLWCEGLPRDYVARFPLWRILWWKVLRLLGK